MQFTQAGNYTAPVANSAGSTNSIAATLTVNPLPPCDPAPSGLISWWPGEGNANDIVGGQQWDAGLQSHLWQWQGGTGVRLGWQHQLYHGVGFACSLAIGATGSGITIEGWINPKQLGPVGVAGLPIVELADSSQQ